jgi:hypothetical protein
MFSAVTDVLQRTDTKKLEREKAEAARERAHVEVAFRIGRDFEGNGWAGTVNKKIFGCNEFAVTRVDGTKSTQQPPVSSKLARSLSTGRDSLLFSPTDDEFAHSFYWLDLASKQGDDIAAVSLGDLYQSGAAVRPDPVRALQYYQLAAGRNSADGQKKLARMYAEGVGVARNLKESERLKTLATATLTETFNWCSSRRVLESMQKLIQANIDRPSSVVGLARDNVAIVTNSNIDLGTAVIQAVAPSQASGLDHPFQCKVTIKHVNGKIADATPYERYSYRDTDGWTVYSDNSKTIEARKASADMQTLLLNAISTDEVVDVEPLGGRAYKISNGSYYDKLAL